MKKHNLWFCLNCPKPALNAIFVEKYIKGCCYILLHFFEATENWIAKIEEHDSAIFNNLKTIKKNAKDNSIT